MNGGTLTVYFKGNSADLDKTMKGVSSSFGGMTKSIVAGLGITKVISGVFNTMSASMDDAIYRFDTMNNFPKVMSNLGIGAEESEKSIKRLSDELTGLPTTLDAGARAVQRFTSANNDIEKSTDMFLAVNNAILAGGASMEIQSSALEQLSQSYAKGKMDMMEWRTLQTAMPAQLNQVAQAMGMSTEAMGEGLRLGTIEMDSFMDTIVKLNTEGVGEFASFEEQAKGSVGGLGTSITNIKTAVVRGLTGMLDSLNESLTNANLPTIGEMLQNIGKKITSAFNSANKVISKIDWNKVITAIKIMTPIVVGLVAGFATFKVITGIINAVSIAMGILNAVMAMNPIMLIVIAIAALVAAFIYLWNTCEPFKQFFINLWEGIKNAVVGAWNFIKGIFTGIINFIKKNWKALLLMIVNPFAGAFKLLYDNCEGFRNFVNKFVAKVKSFFVGLGNGIKNVASNIVNFIKSIPTRIKNVATRIINVFKNLPKNMLNIGKNIMKGLWNGITGLKDWVVNKVKGIGKSILNGLKGVLGIHSPSKEFAIIGKFSMLGYEEGLEKMQPELQRSINGMFNLSPSMIGSMNNLLSPNISVNNNISMETDPLGQMVSKIKTFGGGAKNDFNYGMGG